MSQVIDTVKSALQTEVASEQFFRKAAELTGRDDSRLVFMELAELEARHVHHMAEDIDRSSLDPAFSATVYVEGLEERPGVVIPEDEASTVRSGDVRSIIRLAESREREAQNRFLFLAREEQDTAIQVLYTRLSRLEDEHIDALRQLQTSLDMRDADRPAL